MYINSIVMSDIGLILSLKCACLLWLTFEVMLSDVTCNFFDVLQEKEKQIQIFFKCSLNYSMQLCVIFIA